MEVSIQQTTYSLAGANGRERRSQPPGFRSAHLSSSVFFETTSLHLRNGKPNNQQTSKLGPKEVKSYAIYVARAARVSWISWTTLG